MMQLEDIKANADLLNAIDWEMTPEEAVRLYLEWGNNWAHAKRYVIRSSDDETHYFVVYAWEEEPYILLIRRNSSEAEELARIELPKEVKAAFRESVGDNHGVYAVDGKVREWLQGRLYDA
ncbi:MAG: hypothetical protein JEZ02_19175 [Desulfatibacillum sp.]|nr:hypothetical protein [Desulfatibacillum sp.]